MFKDIGFWNADDDLLESRNSLWNNYQFATYAQSIGGCSQFISLSRLKDSPFKAPGLYSTPAADGAWWYDEDIPESNDFAGVYMLDIKGWSTLGSANVSPGLDGGVMGPYTLDPKTLTCEALLASSSCAGLEYGYRALGKKLRNSCYGQWEKEHMYLGNVINPNEFPEIYAGAPRYGDASILRSNQLIFFDSEPTIPDLYDETPDRSLMYFTNIEVIKDPEIIEYSGGKCCAGCGGTVARIQWTFLLENPRAYTLFPIYTTENDEINGKYDDDDIGVTPKNPSWECVVCEDIDDGLLVEPTEIIEVEKQKRRFGVKVFANESWCPVGWELEEYFDNPEEGYLEIVESELQGAPVNIFITSDGTFAVMNGDLSLVTDFRSVNLCSVNFEITHYAPNPIFDVAQVSANGYPLKPIGSGHTEKVIKIKLLFDEHRGGRFVLENGTPFDPRFHLRPNIRIEVVSTCSCEGTDSIGEITLNRDQTWQAHFQYKNEFPPANIGHIAIRNQKPGTYITEEEVPVSNAFGSPTSIFDNVITKGYELYSQPLESYRRFSQCIIPRDIFGSNNVYGAQPIFKFYSGDQPLYNFSLDFYRKEIDSENPDFCSFNFDIIDCIEPDFSIRVGRMIPARSEFIYEPSINRFYVKYITALGVGGISTDYRYFDAEGLVSGKNGGNPHLTDIGCSGMCVMIFVEIRRDEVGDIVSPAENSTFSLGIRPYVMVGS